MDENQRRFYTKIHPLYLYTMHNPLLSVRLNTHNLHPERLYFFTATCKPPAYYSAFLQRHFRFFQSGNIFSFSLEKYMNRPSAITITTLFLGICSVHPALRISAPSICSRSASWKKCFLISMESARSTWNHRTFPLSTRAKRSSSPQPILTQTAPGYFRSSFFTVSSNKIVLAITPSWERNRSSTSWHPAPAPARRDIPLPFHRRMLCHLPGGSRVPPARLPDSPRY